MVHFDKAGEQNTKKTLELAVERAKELGIKDIVIASHTEKANTINSFLEMGDIVENFRVSCVTHHVGFKEPGSFESSEETLDYLRNKGVKVLTTTHLFANIERDITNKFGGLYPGGIVSATLRCFGQGVKVCFEISVMALDAGLIPYGEDIIAIAGKARGADTAVVISPAHSNKFFDTRLREIICMPRG